MIEESEKLKSSLEGKAEHLADQLVPYTLGGAGLTWLFTRNITKAISVLMVDFSCALKLAMPIAVLSAIREARKYSVTIKGGKYLEAVSNTDTIVFDKTGTLTKAQPTVVDVISFNGREEDDLFEIVKLKTISDALMKRIQRNYHSIVGINTGLILFGIMVLLQPTTSALLHNTSTLMISLKSMTDLLGD